MKFKPLFAAACVAIPAVFGYGAHAAYAQARGAQPPATDTEATAIPGVVAAGAKVHVIKDGFSGSEGTIALPDGSVIFSETTANRTIASPPCGMPARMSRCGGSSR